MDTTTRPPIDLDALVEKFVRLRDKKKELADKHKDELKPYKEALEKLEAFFMEYLRSNNTEKFSSKHGTVHKTRRQCASLADKQAFWNFCVATGNFELLDYKANPVAVGDYLAKQEEAAKADPSITPAPPPGVNYSVHVEIGVKRGNDKE